MTNSDMSETQHISQERVLIGHGDPDVLDAIATCAIDLGCRVMAARHQREVRQLLPMERLRTLESVATEDGETNSIAGWNAADLALRGPVPEQGNEHDHLALPNVVVLDAKWLSTERHVWAHTLLERAADLGCCVLSIEPGEDASVVQGVDDRIALPIDPDRVRSSMMWAMRQSELRSRLRQTEAEIEKRDATIAVLTRRLDRMAERDTLTGLPNRRATMDHLRMLWDRMARPTDGLALIICDLDDFHRLNTTFGQEAGDAVLRQVGAALRSRVRADDFVGRIGNEEFLIVLNRINLEGAYRRAEDLRNAVATTPIRYSDSQRPVTATASFGVAMRSAEDPDLDHLLIRTMQALENAKAAGQDCVELVDHPRRAA